MLLGTAFFNRYVENILSKVGPIGPVNPSPAAIAETTENIPAVYVEINGKQKSAADLNVAELCASAPAGGLLSMGKTFVEVKTAVMQTT